MTAVLSVKDGERALRWYGGMSDRALWNEVSVFRYELSTLDGSSQGFNLKKWVYEQSLFWAEIMVLWRENLGDGETRLQ